MLKRLVALGFRLLVSLVYRAYSIEGVNALLLMMPAKLIAPTLRRYGASVGQEVEIHSPLLIHNADPRPGRHYAHLTIGDQCYFGRDMFLDLKDELCFEDNVTVSMRVTFVTHTDVGRSPLADRIPPTQAAIIVRRGAYIGASSTILQGVEIGAEAVVGAGALVRDNIRPAQIAVGVPARHLELTATSAQL